MNVISRISPVGALRVSLGVMYLYSGFDLMFHPTAWYWALPFWLKNLITAVIPLDLYIRLQGGVEVLFAVVFLAWFMKPALVRITALLSTLEFAVILALAFIPWSAANFTITFRDIGLLGASLALVAILQRKALPVTQ